MKDTLINWMKIPFALVSWTPLWYIGWPVMKWGDSPWYGKLKGSDVIIESTGGCASCSAMAMLQSAGYVVGGKSHHPFPLFYAVFTNTPAVFLYRDTKNVCRSVNARFNKGGYAGIRISIWLRCVIMRFVGWMVATERVKSLSFEQVIENPGLVFEALGLPAPDGGAILPKVRVET